MTDRAPSPPSPLGDVTASAPRIDCHAHVFDFMRHPAHRSRGFDVAPEEAGTPQELLEALTRSGLTGALLVNPLGGYGTDAACLLDALASHPGVFKGVALMAHGTPEREWLRLHQAGVIGLRFNLNFRASPSLHGPGAARTLGLARELGWFAQVHYEGATLVEALPALQASGLRLVIDHLGRPDFSAGADPSFEALLRLGRESDAIVKLSGAFRLRGTRFPYAESDAVVEALIDAFTLERCVWGSDWPFLRTQEPVSHAALLRVLERWLPDVRDREKILSANPARLFGFGPVPAEASA
jgi:predicted TIM-barrel fold metal-dependent hydrolase